MSGDSSLEEQERKTGQQLVKSVSQGAASGFGWDMIYHTYGQ